MTSIKAGCATRSLYTTSVPKAEGFAAYNQKERGPGSFRLCRGLDKAVI